MEFELVTECAEDDYAFGAEDVDNEYPIFEGDDGERCGICMDVVVDRGVLDCCQHWFCFTCIDNWASITNLCPLCQNEFQLITCVPVYDTIGSIQPDEGSYSRDDDDWFVEGRNNTLSFPSYYIDENAVSCLEGDSCKIRGRTANVEDDPDLDTSIACDSCDMWYHAICVGFDPDGSCEDSWLCPRCLADETSLKMELGPSNNHGPESCGHGHLADATFPMNVSVSVADAGETAVVVSIINGNQQAKVPSQNMLSVNPCKDLKIGNQTNEIILSTSDVLQDMGIDKASGDENCKLIKELDEKVIKKPKIEAVELDFSLSQGTTSQFSGLSRDLKEETSEPNVSDEQFDNISLVLSDKYKTGETEENNVSGECRLPANTNPDNERAGGITGAKRKQRNYSVEEGETKGKAQNSVSTKIVKTERSRVAHSMDESVPDDSRNSNSAAGGGIVRKRKARVDIKDIVQGTYRRPSKHKEAASGLRVKKIMRRTSEDKESLVVVQNLRKEIRDAIRNRSSKDVGDNLFDPKLLAAFRTALSGPTTDIKRPPPRPLDLKAKKALLHKGTIRENLTKKIYGVGGKRKRAWTRDCEIEFWKHRCTQVSKPEKIETLKSVLDLLRKGPEVKKENNVDTPNSILSRLYVADASVFPRKDDIKPLSAVKTTTPSSDGSVFPKNDDVKPLSAVKTPTSSAGGKSPEITGACVQPTDNGSKKGRNVNRNKKESGNGCNDIKMDKKKWALEVLARKTAGSGNNSSQGQDKAVLKGNYPLLAKLPVDMRPVLAPSRHNKIPISIRQAQLYRLTEDFLRKTNMPVTHPTAEIELAVADAVNVEKSVADRSNSKLVYVNLCSQELLHRSDNTDTAVRCDNSATADVDVALKDTAVPSDNSATADVDVALRNAGLLSDSPPNSPRQEEEEDGPDNVFEMDPQPELDIYGDFEYDLDDDDDEFIGAIKTSNKLQQDDSKIKMVFSTLESDKAWRFEDNETPSVVENANEDNKSSVVECEELYGPDKEPLIEKYPEIKPIELHTHQETANTKEKKSDSDKKQQFDSRTTVFKKTIELVSETHLAAEQTDGKCSENSAVVGVGDQSSSGVDTLRETVNPNEKKSHSDKKQQSDKRTSVCKKVEAYIKEHIRPLCKSGVITVEQYRWAVGKTSNKIMKYHSKDTNANFLVKEGEKVKKLAQQYVEAAQKVDNNK